MITFDARRRMFHIQTAEMSYLCSIGQDNRLVHRYWGSRLKDTEDLGELSQDWPVQDAGCSDAVPPVVPRAAQHADALDGVSVFGLHNGPQLVSLPLLFRVVLTVPGLP